MVDLDVFRLTANEVPVIPLLLNDHFLKIRHRPGCRLSVIMFVCDVLLSVDHVLIAIKAVLLKS